MTRDEVYDAWAPAESTWAAWVKPVLFSCLSDVENESAVLELHRRWQALAARIAETGPWVVVVELPGADGVLLGICLSRVGFQPVPLHTGLPHPRGLVSLRGVIEALVRGAPRLGDFRPGAPPAFLVDASRMTPERPLRASYDNRSQVLPTDFPSAGKLASHGLRRALLVRTHRDRLGLDLESVLLGWQRQGLELWRLVCTEALPPERFELEPPSLLARAVAWLSAASPRRRRDGAFGRFWPQGG